jgi:ribosomal peptide maturation radical SAM protein 1
MYRITLINMPLAELEMPSIGLTQLKSLVDAMHGDKVETEILYLNLDFAHYIGIAAHRLIMGSLDHDNTGLRDWFFRQSAFPDLEDNIDAYLQRYYPSSNNPIRMYRHVIEEKRKGLNNFLNDMAAKYRIDKSSVVGFTSMFSQNVASFAMARIIKARNPEVITVIGGANCESPMGEEIAKNVEAIDFVFSGPALKSFPEFINNLLDERMADCHKINGVFSKANCSVPQPQASLGQSQSVRQPVRTIGDDLPINNLIELDYRPFLQAAKEHFPGNEVHPAILFETSRGCWWGEKSHCTFCGLNGMGMNYRAMSPDNAIRQFQSLFRYADRVTRFQCVDNILPKNYIKEVFPHINPPKHVTIFYEVKADIDEEDIRALSKARVVEIQPGVESLATSTLKLMKKGTTVFQNLSLLKNCALYGVWPAWNLLLGFPGEGEEVYRSYVKNLPLLTHLPPPNGVFPVRFDRYSPYFFKAKEYGLELHPVDYYEFIYPFNKESLFNLAYYFMDRNITAQYFKDMARWIDRVREKTSYWHKRWYAEGRGLRPELYIKERGKYSIIHDSRIETYRQHKISEVVTQILDFLNKPRKITDIAAEFSHVPQLDTEKEISQLQEQGLIFQEGERYLNLVLSRRPASAKR